jgi:minor extracellular serine protease Vpr
VRAPDANSVAWLSSRGPSIGEYAIKPELVAVGVDVYTATQRMDPNGELYDPSGYASVQGTSFAAPFVAGTAAMVKQRNPSWRPAQIKSAVVNTANSQVDDYDDNGNRITPSILDIGAGKLDARNALLTNVTVEPATLSFGAWRDQLPTGRRLTFRNSASTAVRLDFSLVRPSAGLPPTLSTNSLTVAPGGAADLTVTLTGSRPRAGVYEGTIRVNGGSVPLNIPFVYIVPDGVPFSILPVQGDGMARSAGSSIELILRAVDQYGVAVEGIPVIWRPTVGGGRID